MTDEEVADVVAIGEDTVVASCATSRRLGAGSRASLSLWILLVRSRLPWYIQGSRIFEHREHMMLPSGDGLHLI